MHLKPTLLATVLISLSFAFQAEAHSPKSDKPEPRQKPPTIQQEPQKRQNFRARRADEFPPWEGFEDCPMAFPCVGMIRPHYRRN